jgi:hypothetical protein
MTDPAEAAAAADAPLIEAAAALLVLKAELDRISDLCCDADWNAPDTAELMTRERELVRACRDHALRISESPPARTLAGVQARASMVAAMMLPRECEDGGWIERDWDAGLLPALLADLAGLPGMVGS